MCTEAIRAPQSGGGPRGFLTAATVLLATLLAGCSPALNWRQTAPPVTGLNSLLPCRPDWVERSVPLADAPVLLQMASCEAAGALWAIASVDAQDAARTDPVRQALNDTLLQTLGAAQLERHTVMLSGSRQPAERLEAEGRHPDGHAVHLSLVAFSQGTRVYRASVLRPSGSTPALPEDALTTFVEGLRLHAP